MQLAVTRAPAGIASLVVVALKISMIPEILHSVLCVVLSVILSKSMLCATSLIIDSKNLCQKLD